MAWWGYQREGGAWRRSDEIIRTLVDTVSKNGNLLLIELTASGLPLTMNLAVQAQQGRGGPKGRRGEAPE